MPWIVKLWTLVLTLTASFAAQAYAAPFRANAHPEALRQSLSQYQDPSIIHDASPEIRDFELQQQSLMEDLQLQARQTDFISNNFIENMNAILAPQVSDRAPYRFTHLNDDLHFLYSNMRNINTLDEAQLQRIYNILSPQAPIFGTYQFHIGAQ